MERLMISRMIVDLRRPLSSAIWEQVRTDKERGPTNPLTIPPPKKR
jgi:hypothetical protein